MPNLRSAAFMLLACLVALAAATVFTGPAGAQPAKPEMTDALIASAVENELHYDDLIPFDDIDVNVQNRVVHLKGTVSNLLARERAARIAGTVRGVHAVINRLSVATRVVRMDGGMRDDIVRAFELSAALEAADIEVAVDDGVAVLSGTVDSWQEKALAEKTARGVRGLIGLKNNIMVDPSGQRSDGDIRHDVQQALAYHVLIDARPIDVSVKDGEVRLEGRVGSVREKELVHEVAHVSGAAGVDVSALQVDDDLRADLRQERMTVDVSDEAVRNALQKALAQDLRVAPYDVAVTVQDGVATLRGRVGNLEAKRAAAQDARNTMGVDWVRNRIRVRPTEKMPDHKIETAVRQALERDPFISFFDLVVRAYNGTVYLEGEVDGFYEKARADDLAAGIRGVKRVINRLEVYRSTDAYAFPEPYIGAWDEQTYDWLEGDADVYLIGDEQMKEEIESQLFWSPFVDSDTIQVSVENGVATLTGTVETRAEKSAARTNAIQGGAVKVINRLEVRNSRWQ